MIDSESSMQVNNLSYICSTYVEMASPVKPAKTVAGEIEIFFAIIDGPGNENYIYPKDRKAKNDEIANEIKKQANYLFVDKKFAEAVEYYTIASRFASSASVVADAIGNRSACFAELNNNVACLHDCAAALLYGFGNDNEAKRKTLDLRRQKCIKNIGPEGMEKVLKNRKFVESYEGRALFNEDLIEVKYSQAAGYYVRAKTSIPKGTLIIEEKSEYHTALKYETSFPGYCLCCLVKANHPGGFVPCNYCTTALYCSQKCKENHMEAHSLECCYMLLLQSFPDAGMLMQAIVKDLSYLTREIYERQTVFPVKKGDKYQQSYSNVDLILDWKDTEKRDSNTHVQARRHIALCYHVLSYLNQCMGYDLETTPRSIMRCLELFMINSLNQLGVGDGVVRLFPNVSLINHSCKRNTVYLSGGHWLKVHLTVDLECGDEVTTSYSVNENKKKRLVELKEKYGFDCRCDDCTRL